MIRNVATSNAGFTPPYGAILREGGVDFSFVARSATGARLLLYDDKNALEPSEIIPFDPARNRWGDVWKLFVPGAGPGTLYHFQVDGPFAPTAGCRFDGRARLLDPYARALAGEFLPKTDDGRANPPKCVVVDDYFDWGDAPRIRREFADEIVYELHVRGFTQSPTSGVSKPGTYLGLIEKIPYLKSLGVTAVELMPIHEFAVSNPNGRPSNRPNYWGYDPIAFFAPHRGYAWSDEPGAQVREFKETVRAFHEAGLEVFLDVVFNHTAEGDERGETFLFKGFENRNYYHLDASGQYRNYSGCGNSVNGNHPWTRELILNCLRSWARNYRIDGFRFDLASILSRDRDGNLVANPPALETIAEDPQLAGVKIVAEAWDAAGAYQVGEFGSRRWAEWNGRYRDDVRRFWRGDDWTTGTFATRLSGSSDLYRRRDRAPFCSVNFVDAHDGFTLNDLTTYNVKHNYGNGEENRDGENNNVSYNFGVEGETDDPGVLRLRARQVRNYLTTLMLSQGVPMFVAGDEARRTQGGNNNAYCQDSPISWFDWSLVEKNADLKRFCAALIRFRRREASLRRRSFYDGAPQIPGGLPDVAWFDPFGGEANWNAAQPPMLTILIDALDVARNPEFAAERFKLEAELPDVFAESTVASPVASTAETRPGSAESVDSPLIAGLERRVGGFVVDEPARSRFAILAMFNASPFAQAFYFPAVAKLPKFDWRTFVDVSAPAPNDVYPDCDGPAPFVDAPIRLPERSTKVFVSKVL